MLSLAEQQKSGVDDGLLRCSARDQEKHWTYLYPLHYSDGGANRNTKN